MKKFIEITLIFTVVVVIATLLAVLFGMNMSEGQKVALFAFCFGGCLLAMYWLILSGDK